MGETLSSSGTDHNAVWPALPEDENKRESKRSGVYGFTMTNEKNEDIAYQLTDSDWRKNESVWQELKEGQAVKIQTSGGSATLQDENKNKLSPVRQVR